MIFVIIGAILLLLLILLFTSRTRIRKKFNKLISTSNSSGLNGEETANIVMQKNGLRLSLIKDKPDLCDAYYPTKQTLLMSEKVCDIASIASVAIVCHELGHAMQHKERTPLYKINTLLSKITRFTNKFIIPLIIFGLVFYAFKWPTETAGLIMTFTGIGLFVLHALLKILVIPLEFDASRRAVKMIEQNGLLNKREIKKSKALLNTAGQTYIVGLFDGFTVSVKKLFRLFR